MAQFQAAHANPPQRVASLGHFNVLPDVLVFGILGKLDAVTLARAVPRLSKWFYIFAKSEDLWKPLCIVKYLGAFHFLGTYRETYAGKPLPAPQLDFTGTSIKTPETITYHTHERNNSVRRDC